MRLNLEFGWKLLFTRKLATFFNKNHDNTSAYSALSISEFLADKQILVVLLPPYSPDFVPCDFIIFSKIKTDLKGQRFDDIETIKVVDIRHFQFIYTYYEFNTI